jgi:L-asparaginase/Glu-tRNA(Gln) amidotransferase subunit D
MEVLQIYFLSVNNQSVTLIYVDGTQGWNVVQESNNVRIILLAATGGTITCCGDYKIHTFTGPGTFTVYFCW